MLFPLLLFTILSNTVIDAALLARYSAPEECDWHLIRNHLINSQNANSNASLPSPFANSNSAALASDPTLASDAVAVICRLRTINGPQSSEQPTNFSLIQAARTASLRLLCDDLLIASAISNNSFHHLGELKQLSIERCKLGELPGSVFSGLAQLKQLTIRSQNIDWDVQLNLKSPSLFGDLKRLEQLDLSTNNLVNLPEDLFCDLHSLSTLNLSTNTFSDVSAIGFSSKQRPSRQCKVSSLSTLDLTGNRLKVLTDRGFGVLATLKQLTLHDNQISRAEEHSLAGLNELNLLVLSNNELVALPPRFFQPVQGHLTELYLQNNSISVLPPGLFNNLGQLTILDLSHNEITSHWINSGTFGQLKQLANLDLSFNKLTKLDASTFNSLTQLQVLLLHHNELEILGEHVFSPLVNLQQLVLSHNRLHRIESNIFTGLTSLRSLAIDANQLNYIHPLALRNISEVMELNCSSNRFESVPHAINDLHQLRSLDLSYNRLKDIKNTSYQGNEQLYSLNLESNQIGNLSKGVFVDLPGLRILNLALNRIASIEQGSFDDVPDLHFLRLDGNQLTEINSLFSHLRDLLMLNISHNSIAWFDYALIPFGLQLLDLHNNQIETLGNYYDVDHALKLRTLDVSGNRIRELDASSLPSGIEIVNLKENLLRKVAAFTFLGKQNLTKVDLSANHLTGLEMNAFQLSKGKSLRKQLAEFSVRDNPFVCDCTLDWLQRASTLDESKQYPKFVDLDQVTCTLVFGTIEQQTQPRLLSQIQPNEFLCSYDRHCFALCTCCQFEACDCKMTCPENCNCYYDASWNTNIVDCGGPVSQRAPINSTTMSNSLNSISSGVSQYTHRSLPFNIPMDATELYLDGNDIPILTSHAFIGRKNMRILHLNNSNIQTIHNRTFNGLRALRIHLDHNKLTTLYGYEFERLYDLTELYLSHNQLQTIANSTFGTLKNLRVLTLDHNHLVQFNIWTLIGAGNAQPHSSNLLGDQNGPDSYNALSGNPNYITTSSGDQLSNGASAGLIYLTIAHNLWSCECEFTARLLAIEPELQMSIIRDAASVQCYLNDTHSVPLFNGQFNQSLCIHEVTNLRDKLRNSSAFQRFQVEHYLPFALIGVSSLLILLFGVIALLIYRREMSVWFYSKYGLRLNQRTSSICRREEDRLFDAYLSYSKREEAFVTQVLAPELEYGNPSCRFRLCLHYRDLPVATDLLSQAIAEAMHASRRTVLLLSESYLKNEWTKFEFKHAHLEMLRTNRHKLIFILLGSINLKELQGTLLVFFLHFLFFFNSSFEMQV